LTSGYGMTGSLPGSMSLGSLTGSLSWTTIALIAAGLFVILKNRK